MSRLKNRWWLLVLGATPLPPYLTGTLITNRLLPSDIGDDKKSFWTDFQIPGLDYTPFDHVRNDNTHVSFTVPIINKQSPQGNMFEMAAVDLGRSTVLDISDIGLSAPQWRKNPLCIYSGWGTHRPPLPCIIEDAKYLHRRDFTNAGGWAQWTDVTFTLRYDESNALYVAWKQTQAAMALVQAARASRGVGYQF